MNIPRLDTEQITVTFDTDTGISVVTYRGELSPQVTVQYYQFLPKFLEVVDVQDIYGSIYDFRQVTKFHNTNLSTAQRASQSANTHYDFSAIPIALLVETLLQEQMVRVSMKVTPQETRKRIVKSEAEAKAFFKSFHQRRQSAADSMADVD